MHVLLMGAPGPGVEDAARKLEDAGHRVLRCHDDDEPVFPCKGLQGRCPLDHEPVDVALVVRNHAWPRPTPFDRGVTCVVRQRVPVAFAGVTVLNPYEPWADAVLSWVDDPVEALDRLARHPRPEHSRIATEALRESLHLAGLEPGDACAEVVRRNGWLRVRLSVPGGLHDVRRQNAARKVITALRAFDRHARGIDVEFAEQADGRAWARDTSAGSRPDAAARG